jgi:glucokinase
LSESLLVGADVGGTSVKYVVLDAAGHRHHEGSVPTDAGDPRATIDRLAGALGAYELAGVGLACAGIVAPASGMLGRSPNLPGWENSNLKQALAGAFGELPVALANDVNAALYGEFRHGAGRGCRHLVMIALGTGVGGGVIVDRQLVTGHGDGAGEIGHLTLDLEGPICTCGNPGCLEAYCGSVGLLRRARELAVGPRATPAYRELIAERGEQLTVRHCAELATSGDATAGELFAEAGRRLGQAAAGIINVLAPDRVIIGGGVAQAGELLLVPCRAMVARFVMSEAGRHTPVVSAGLGTHAAAVGAAALAAEAGAGT